VARNDDELEQIKVEFGNPKAVHHPPHSDPEKAARGEHERRRLRPPRGVPEVVTVFTGPPGARLSDVFKDLTHPVEGGVAYHFDGDPSWVASNNPALADLLAAEYGCEVRPFVEERHAHPMTHALAERDRARAADSSEE
jgi:hypothetical protein